MMLNSSKGIVVPILIGAGLFLSLTACSPRADRSDQLAAEEQEQNERSWNETADSVLNIATAVEANRTAEELQHYKDNFKPDASTPGRREFNERIYQRCLVMLNAPKITCAAYKKLHDGPEAP